MRWGRTIVVLNLLWAVACPLAYAEGESAYVCDTPLQSINATSITKKNANKQYYIDATATTSNGIYAQICFNNVDSLNLTAMKGTQLLINNTLDVPLLIENLTVQQSVTPSQCGAGATACPSIIITGKSPVILRNPRIEWTGPASTSETPTTTDGIAIQSDHVTIEVTPERQADPAYVTVANFRTGIVLAGGVGSVLKNVRVLNAWQGIVVDGGSAVTLDQVQVRRETPSTGSAGIRIASGVGHTIWQPTIECVETGLHIVGGTAAAPTTVHGGTLVGTTWAWNPETEQQEEVNCQANTGAFLQGSHVWLTETNKHALSITKFPHGAILDPVGPMGVKGGDISNADVGLEVRNATPATLLALSLQPDTFTLVAKSFDFTTATAATSPTVTWSKTCAKTTMQTVEGKTEAVCDTSAADNVVSAIEGMVMGDLCPSMLPGKVVMYTEEFSVTSFASICTMNNVCSVVCVEDNGLPLAIPLGARLSPSFLLTSGGFSLEPIKVTNIMDKHTDLGPLAPLPLPIVLGAAMEDNSALDGVLPGDEDGADADSMQVAGVLGDDLDAMPQDGATPVDMQLPGDDATLPPTDDRAGTTTTAAAAGGNALDGGASIGVAGCSLIRHYSGLTF